NCDLRLLFDMKELQEIVDFVTSGIPSKFNPFDAVATPATDRKLFRLAQGMRNKHFKDDAHASKILYGRSPDTASYRMLKTRLKEKLVDSIFMSHNTHLLKFP